MTTLIPRVDGTGDGPAAGGKEYVADPNVQWPATVVAVTPTTILYDDDCGFCRASLALLLAWDRRGRLRPVPLQSEEAEKLLPGLGPEERMASMHAAPAEGPPASGGAALPTLLRELPGGAPLAALAARFPRLSERGYAGVAGNRSLLSKLVPTAVARRADELVRKRL